MNGALTTGTLDGANVEIRDEMGAENVLRFGLRPDEVQATKAGGHQQRDRYDANPELRAVLDFVASGRFSHGDRKLFGFLVRSLFDRDESVDAKAWPRMSIANLVRIAKFSSDRAIRPYWHTAPVHVGVAP
jgi:starch phosphorylase